jgi:hypothetical protein
MLHELYCNKAVVVGWGCSSAGECLPTMGMALSSIPNTTHTKWQEKRHKSSHERKNEQNSCFKSLLY